MSELGHKIIIIVKDSDSCPPGPVSDGCTRYTTQRDRERQCETERGGVYESGGLQGLTHTSVYIKKTYPDPFSTSYESVAWTI